MKQETTVFVVQKTVFKLMKKILGNFDCEIRDIQNFAFYFFHTGEAPTTRSKMFLRDLCPLSSRKSFPF